MKKTLIAVLALAALAACNKTEVVDQPVGNAIAFDNAFVDNATKSVNDPSYTNTNMFDDFVVYGYVEGAELFPGTVVSKNITNEALTKTDWKYEGTKYWIAGAKYNFNAVAPSTGANWTKTEASAAGVKLSFTNNGTQDVLYAKTAELEGKAASNSPVEFSFRHILSKVKFSFVNGYNATNATIKVKDIKINNAYAKGNATLDESTTWAVQDATLVLDFGMATDNEATADVAENAEMAYAYNSTYESQKELFLIPGSIAATEATETTAAAPAGYKVTFTVELLVSGTLVKTYNHTTYVDLAPVAGQAYDITATVTAENIDPEHAQEPIEFTVAALPEWGTTNNVNQTL